MKLFVVLLVIALASIDSTSDSNVPQVDEITITKANSAKKELPEKPIAGFSLSELNQKILLDSPKRPGGYYWSGVLVTPDLLGYPELKDMKIQP